MKTLKKYYSPFFLLILLCSFQAKAQTADPTGYVFECLIIDYTGGNFGYEVIDGWEKHYGPYRTHEDAEQAAGWLLFDDECQDIVDLSRY